MSRAATMVVFLVLALAAIGSEQPAASDTPGIEELHDLVHLDGIRVGQAVTTITPVGREEQLTRTVHTLELTLRRNGTPVRLRMEHGTVETATGLVKALSLRQGTPGGRQLTLDGTLSDGVMQVKIDGGRVVRKVRWPDEVVGLREQERQFQARKVKPGERFLMARYEPTYNAVLTVRVEIKDRESVDVLGTQRSLLRVEMTPDPLQSPTQRIQPARVICWLDEDLRIARQTRELDGLGSLVLTRVTKAKVGGTGSGSVDIGSRSLVPLNRRIPRPYETRKVRYRLTLTGDDRLADNLISDGHQKIESVMGNRCDLLVAPSRDGSGGGEEPVPAKDYLAANSWIDHEGERISELTARAVGKETDPWRKAQHIERFVHDAMVVDQSLGLIPASQVAKNLRGDCRQHAFLTAAMCRAAGVPSRTAIGLLYVERGGPKLGFHMWVEVYVSGRWRGLDSTLGKGGVSGAHVKVTQHGWHEVASLTPLLPVTRLIGKLRGEVLMCE